MTEERISVTMTRAHLRDVPRRPLPEGYVFRMFAESDEASWVSVQTAAGLFDNEEKAMEQFRKEFAEHIDEMVTRCFFIVHQDSGEDVGAAVAWHNRDYGGGEAGRVHWVAVRPEHQGRGLGKPLVARVLDRLAESHPHAMLGSNTMCRTAIRIYLDLGFEPVMTVERAADAWALLAAELDHPRLRELR